MYKPKVGDYFTFKNKNLEKTFGHGPHKITRIDNNIDGLGNAGYYAKFKTFGNYEIYSSLDNITIVHPYKRKIVSRRVYG